MTWRGIALPAAGARFNLAAGAMADLTNEVSERLLVVEDDSLPEVQCVKGFRGRRAEQSELLASFRVRYSSKRSPVRMTSLAFLNRPEVTSASTRSS